MRIKNMVLAVYDQLIKKDTLRNIVVRHDAFGIFSRTSHIVPGGGKPKISYSSKATAIKAAEAMSKKYDLHFYAYKCAWCDGWHVGKHAQYKVKPEVIDATRNFAFIKNDNVLYEALKQYPIVDLAPVYNRGVRGRTMSGCDNIWMLSRVRDAGVKVVIDLRTHDYTTRYGRSVEDAGLEYHSIPIDGRQTNVRNIIPMLPLLFELLDRGSFYIACAHGLHRTDIAIALYYVFHPSVPFGDVPEMRGYRDMDNKTFRCDDIAARLNSIIRAITPEELVALGLAEDYEVEFNKRKKHLLDVNRNFEWT